MARTTFPKFVRDLNDILEKTVNKRTLDRVGRTIRDRIREVTDQGKTMAQASGKLSRLAILKDSTKRQKRRRGISTRSRLRETEKMMDDLSFSSNVNKQTVAVSNRKKSEKKKAGFAQDGSKDRDPRPFIPDKRTGLDRKTNRMVLDILFKNLKRNVKRF